MKFRDYTNSEFWAIQECLYNRALIKYSYSSYVVEYLARNLPHDDVYAVIKRISGEYHRIWDIANSFNKVPVLEDILILIDKRYGEYKADNRQKS